MRQWAGPLEGEAVVYRELPRTAATDSEGADFGSDPSRAGGAASGTPEHWAKLVASAPPEHWLELIRQKAPELLAPTETEWTSLLSGDENAEASLPPGPAIDGQFAVDNDSLDGSQRLPRRPYKHTREPTKDSKTATAKRTWLNRLRFQPPRSKAAADHPTYVSPGPQANSSDPSAAAGESSVVGFESLTTARERLGEESKAASVKRPTWRERSGSASRNVSDSKPETNYRTSYPTDRESVETRSRAKATGKEIDGNQSAKQSRQEQANRQRISENRRTVLAVSLEAGDKRSRNSPILNTAETQRAERTSLPAQLEHSGSAGSEVPRRRALSPLYIDSSKQSSFTKGQESVATTVQRREAGISDDKSNVSYPSSAKSSRIIYQPLFASHRDSLATAMRTNKSDVNAAAGGDDATNNFASIDRTAMSLLESWTISNSDQHGSVWPRLPGAATLDFADELAARESETESLRRLQQEQRGDPWNA